MFQAAILLLLCQPSATAGVAQQCTLPSGTEVKLTLLDDIGSGGSRLDSTVAFLVSDDIKDPQGKILIASGTLATAKVAQVRREGALSAPVFDHPARLALTLEKTWTVDKQVVHLKANLNKKPYELYQFTRDNTQMPMPKNEDKALKDAWKVKRKYNLIAKLVGIFKGGGNGEDFKDRTELVALSELAETISLGNTVDLIVSGRLNALHELIVAIRSRRVFSGIAAIGSGIVGFREGLLAVKELAHLSHNVGQYVGGRFKGRNIKAPAGLEIICFTGEEMQVTIS